MKLILEIKNPGEWEILMAFLLQKGIDFRMADPKNKTSSAISKETVLEDKPSKNIEWKFSDHVFPEIENQTFSREEIYEDADWEKNLY